MVNVVDVATAIAQVNQRFDTGNDVVTVQRALCVGLIKRQTHVHFHAANSREVIAFAIKEQRVKERRRGLNGGRLARTHDAVDVHERGVAVHVLVHRHGVAHVGADVDVVDVQQRNLGDARVDQLFRGAADQRAVFVVFQRQLVTGFDVDRTGFFVDDVTRNEFANDVIERQQQVFDLAFVEQFFDGARGDLFGRFEQDFTCRCIHQIISRTGAAHAVGEEGCNPALVLLKRVGDGFVVSVHDRFLIQPKGIEQGRHRQFTATVNPGKDDVFCVEFKVQPRAAVGDDAAGEQELARRVGLALVVVKEHARRTVHLGYDHTLGAVNDKGAVRRH